MPPAFTTRLLDLDGDPAARAVMVGEAPATDTAGARCAGIAAVLVGDRARLRGVPASQRPDAVVSGLAGLLEGRRG